MICFLADLSREHCDSEANIKKTMNIGSKYALPRKIWIDELYSELPRLFNVLETRVSRLDLAGLIERLRFLAIYANGV